MLRRSVVNSHRIITNPFTGGGIIRNSNITQCFSHKHLRHLPISNIHIPILDAERLSNDTEIINSLYNSEDINVLDNIEIFINETHQTLPRWMYIDNKSSIDDISDRIITITRDILNILGGDNIIGLLSNVLTEYEIINYYVMIRI